MVETETMEMQTKDQTGTLLATEMRMTDVIKAITNMVSLEDPIMEDQDSEVTNMRMELQTIEVVMTEDQEKMVVTITIKNMISSMTSMTKEVFTTRKTIMIMALRDKRLMSIKGLTKSLLSLWFLAIQKILK